MNFKNLILSLLILFSCNDLFSQEVVRIKDSGYGDLSIRIKESGYGDISVRIKESGYGDVSIRIKESGTVDYLIYSDKEWVSKSEIIAALINVIKQKAGYEE